jgi:hypothetical protein
MGEYAEMMLDGTMCSSCGVYIGRDNGFPEMCGNCAGEERRKEKPFVCGNDGGKCQKRFASKEARSQHRKDAHGLVVFVETP